MSDLALLVPSLKREVATPGTFATLFPDTLDSDLLGSLKDAFWTARLDGWFPDVSIDDLGLTTPDLNRDGQQLIVVYAASAIIRTQLRNIASRRTYKVGALEVQTEYASNVLSQQLNENNQRIKDLLNWARYGGGTTVTTFDGYAFRALGFYDLDALTDGRAGVTYGIDEMRDY
ncbi:MAG: hypothetical protein ACXVYY_01430 [Oryzihumus sp.]